MLSRDVEQQWAQWMRAGLAGDERAYRRLLEALAPALRGIVRSGYARFSANPVELEDVVQETLLAIHLKRQTWDPAEPLTPWVRTIARNKLIDALRRRGKRVTVDIDDFAEVIAAPVPEPTLEARDAERLLSVLSERQREVVRAISLEGKSTSETAQRLGITEGAVRVALHRGLAALAAAYRSEDT